MTPVQPSVYFGKVVHRRLRPVSHQLEYNVASILVDVDQLSHLPGLLAYNRPGLFGLSDSDYGDQSAPRPIKDFAWEQMRKHGAPAELKRIMMLSYPRILGYAFNPLTVFYGLDQQDHVRMVLYEVHNTFGGRHVYPAGPFEPGDATFASAEKVFRVSPFNGVEGHYGLKVSAPGERVSVGVALSTTEGPLLNAYFTGHRKPLSNATLLRVFFSLPLMTAKVMAGIHWEALKLWLKGLKLQAP